MFDKTIDFLLTNRCACPCAPVPRLPHAEGLWLVCAVACTHSLRRGSRRVRSPRSNSRRPETTPTPVRHSILTAVHSLMSVIAVFGGDVFRHPKRFTGINTLDGESPRDECICVCSCADIELRFARPRSGQDAGLLRGRLGQLWRLAHDLLGVPQNGHRPLCPLQEVRCFALLGLSAGFTCVVCLLAA